LESLLVKGPREAGYDSDLWTCARVAEVIKSKFGVSYNTEYVSQLLGKLGWSPQKPESRAIERDEAKILGWRRRTWARIKKKPV
jgi:transposase